jgi:hypothetical protein
MRTTSVICGLLLLLTEAAAGPLRVSRNGRYFVDAATAKPFFWLGSTQWALFRGYSIDEARLTIDKIKSQGFTVVATMLAGGPVATVPNLEGQTIWLNNDPSTPNEAYFKRVDAIITYAVGQGLMVRIGMLHNSQLQYMSNGRGRAYAKFVATRYKHLPNIIWSLHGNVDNPALIAVVREITEAGSVSTQLRYHSGRALAGFHREPDFQAYRSDLLDGHNGLQPHAPQTKCDGRRRV